MTSIKSFLDPRPLLSLALFLVITSCAGKPVPKWDGKTWAGDSARAGITRAQDNQTIRADSPEFDSYVAMLYSDLRKLFAIIHSCKEWPKGMEMMSATEALQRYQLFMLDLERAAKVEREREAK